MAEAHVKIDDVEEKHKVKRRLMMMRIMCVDMLLMYVVLDNEMKW